MEAPRNDVTATLRRRELERLEHRHRLEEVGERFGLTVTPVDAERGRLSFAPLGRVRLGGRPLTPARARARAEAAGLTCDDDGVLLPWGPEADVEAVEDALLAFLGGLLEADPEAFLLRPARGRRLPATLELPESAAWLERFYGGDFLPREKKPVVVDLARCQGPYLRSIDRDPLQIIDAASQIASLPAGFRAGPVQAALDDGRFDRHLLAAVDVRDPSRIPEAAAYARDLLAFAPPGIAHVAFVNSGAEANEKALHIARVNGPGGRRVLAFRGSFHGRTLVALAATWNPKKRERYQIAGYEAAFVPFPVAGPGVDDPPSPPGWRAAWFDRLGAREGFGEADDPVLAAEVASLRAAEEVLRAGDVMACIVEPYQCEGGDRAATARFFQALRGLTRAYDVPLIFDEVQSGFGLSGPVFWHQRFWLMDRAGRPDGPDLITCAKRAQVGVVLSRWPDPAPSHAHGAGLVRGRVHLGLVYPPRDRSAQVRARLAALRDRWPELVSDPRVHGDAVAFDLPDGSIAQRLVEQRFHRGYMVYVAGERTLRYRLHRNVSAADVDLIFEIIEESIAALVEAAGGPGEGLVARMKALDAPRWTPSRPRRPAPPRPPSLEALLADPTPDRADRTLRVLGELGAADRVAGAKFLGLPPDVRGAAALPALRSADPAAFEAAVGVPLLRYAADVLGTRVRRVSVDEFDRITHATHALQVDAYEPARRDSLGYLKSVVASDGGIFLVAEDPDRLVGIAAAGPLERWWMLDGPRQDPNRGRENTLYSADITVAASARGRGVGYRLRAAQVREALAERWPDGQPRYAFITGRNRVGAADAMWELNRKFGAYTVDIHAGQYGELDGLTRYYRIPLRRHDRRAFEEPLVAAESPYTVDVSAGVLQPAGPAHPLLVRARALGVFDEPAMTKLTVSNFITRPYARYAEYLRALAPRGCRHLYFTSSPDEMVDKTIRVLKHRRAAGRLAIALGGGWAGSVTAAARSLTDPRWGGERFGYFDWPFVPHPGADPGRCVAALDALVATHGADALLGLFVESVQACTGEVLDDAAWAALCAWRDRTGVPLVLIETTTGAWRSGRGPWWLEGTPPDAGDPDAVLWWSGGQIGHVFTHDRIFVDEPLAFISTWDGDELSATRLLWQLYACAEAPVVERAAALDAGLRAAFDEAALAGLGLYRVLRLGAGRAARLAAALEADGVRVGRPAPDAVLINPETTVSADAIERLCDALAARAKEVR